ncbi:helix-turn-helix domain-containing protein [Halorarius litoreus]|uniref:helix-turn-helix domain-containing protein n=1 Tax=Halorarius litoreus TaxID=2962676 RepID=UPI0020CC933A|nr:helix-turn-helix domain-containing protein [Halorarius litoreus]
MPISIDEFDKHDSGTEQPTNAERVLRFLLDNREQAFKATEIAEGSGVAQNSIHPVLNRLERRELVRHKEPYWAIGDIEAVRDAFTFHSTAEFLDAHLGEERRSEWLAAADEDDGEDPNS